MIESSPFCPNAIHVSDKDRFIGYVLRVLCKDTNGFRQERMLLANGSDGPRRFSSSNLRESSSSGFKQGKKKVELCRVFLLHCTIVIWNA